MAKTALFKLLKDCKQGEWVFFEAGDLYMVDREKGSSGLSLTNGHFRVYTSDEAKVYPLTLHNKIIADGIHYFYKRMHKGKLINGSEWVNWLDEKMEELIDLGEDAKEEEYQAIWNAIENQVKELEIKNQVQS